MRGHDHPPAARSFLIAGRHSPSPSRVTHPGAVPRGAVHSP
ncbi:hypothetical protein GJR88_01153 [Dietzia sp. DQ12-45-1b]|nr:hypothetical protein GJR88_01153 [Dietzia sp. DQ12-45-1b]